MFLCKRYSSASIARSQISCVRSDKLCVAADKALIELRLKLRSGARLRFQAIRQNSGLAHANGFTALPCRHIALRYNRFCLIFNGLCSVP
jgi:hypothetical protein